MLEWSNGNLTKSGGKLFRLFLFGYEPYVLSHEGVGFSGWSQAHIKFSSDGTNWGSSPSNLGTAVQTASDAYVGACPLHPVESRRGSNGTLVVSGQFLITPSKTDLEFLINTNLGQGNRTMLPAAVQWQGGGNNLVGWHDRGSRASRRRAARKSLHHRHNPDSGRRLDGAVNLKQSARRRWEIPPGFLFKNYTFDFKIFFTFAFTTSSILMSGGQARLKPSPGIFFVASMPILLPLAISLVA